jgi:hypothetical protein
VRLLHGEGLNEDARPAEKHIALALNNDREFQKASGADETSVGAMDEPGVAVSFGLPEQNSG